MSPTSRSCITSSYFDLWIACRCLDPFANIDPHALSEYALSLKASTNYLEKKENKKLSMVFRKKKDSGRRHHRGDNNNNSDNDDWNVAAREQRKRSKMKASASGDVGLELLGMNRKNNLLRNKSTSDDEPLDPFPTIGRGLSTHSFGSIMSFEIDEQQNSVPNRKGTKKKNHQPQQPHIQMRDDANMAKKKNIVVGKVDEQPKFSKAKSKKIKQQQQTSKKPAKDQVDDDFDLEPTILKRLNQASKQKSIRSFQSQESNAHGGISNNLGNPSSHGIHDEIHKPVKSNHLLGLVDHGDWQDLENRLLKSNHRKQRKNGSTDVYDSASCSSSSESSLDGDSSSQVDTSSDESHASSSCTSQSVKTNDDDLSDEESRNIKQTTDHEHEIKMRRKIARMRSAELRRWNGFKPQVQQLLERCNMPHDSARADNLLEQFENREAELLASLQSMAAKFPRQNRASIHKSKHLEMRIASYMSYGTAEALAHIAAASTLDENPIAVKPEYVVDKPVEHSESEEYSSDSYYDNEDDEDDEDVEEESYESESESEEHDNYDDDNDDYDGASQGESQSNPSQSDAESVESNEISLEETENYTVHDVHQKAGNYMLGSGVASSQRQKIDDDSFFDRNLDQHSESSGGSFSHSREESQADWSYSGHDDEDALQQLRSAVTGNRFGYR